MDRRFTRDVSRRTLAFLLALVSGVAVVPATSLTGQAQRFTPPGVDRVDYDASIPTPGEVLGHDPADVITPPEGLVRYFEALAEAAPDRARLVRYAESWEGRPLVLLAIGSAERMADVEGLQRELARLADPRGLSRGEEDRLVATLPVVTALVHSVHGNEISPAASALVTAYHLLAARGDADVDRILRESIVLLDPIQNPDGRARFVAGNQVGAAAVPDPDPLAAERDEPWPGGRANHYLFDLNRDWFIHTQPESRGKVAALLAWNPHVVVDLHEMGGNLTYYFPPAAVPGNPHTTEEQHRLFELFGRENAALFDARGWPYFIREIFDAFYPGYGSSWPTAHGALGQTFEQGSARGLVLERDDGSLLTYGDGIEHNFHAALRTALTAAENRERILRSYLEFRRSAVREGTRGPRAYVLDAGHDPSLAERLGVTLAANGVEVARSLEPFRAGGRDFPAGSMIVPLDQPAARLARNLLDTHTPMDPAFVERQRQRRAQRLRDEIYDVTTWSLPLLWDVDAVPVGARPNVRTEAVHPDGPARRAAGAAANGVVGSETLPPARVGYLIHWSAAGAAAVVEALAAGITVHAAGAGFRLDGQGYGPGTALVRSANLSAEQREALGRIVAGHGVRAVPVESGFVEAGISLGSGQMRALNPPRVMLLWDAPASSLSAGWARWVLEQRYGQHVTAIRARSFGRAELGRYDVIVLPSGHYSGELGEAGIQRLRGWVQDGGTLITLAEATRWAAGEDVGLLATTAEMRAPGPARDSDAQPIDLLTAIAPEQEQPEPVSGAILRVVLDTTSVLAAGARPEMGAMVAGSRVFTPLTLDQGTNVGVYAPLDRLVLSGIVWEDAQPQLASKAFLMRQPLGRGRIIAFAEDPNFRGYAEATQLLFLNAVVLGPSF